MKTDKTDILEIDPEKVKGLLKDSELPTSDINPCNSIFLGNSDQDQIIGCIGLEILGKIGLLRSLAVSKGSRGQGIGLMLTKALIEKAVEKKLEDIYLLTTDAEDFFSRIGFKKIVKDSAPQAVKETKQYSQICSDSAVVMKLSLSS